MPITHHIPGHFYITSSIFRFFKDALETKTQENLEYFGNLLFYYSFPPEDIREPVFAASLVPSAIRLSKFLERGDRPGIRLATWRQRDNRREESLDHAHSRTYTLASTCGNTHKPVYMRTFCYIQVNLTYTDNHTHGLHKYADLDYTRSHIYKPLTDINMYTD